ncbi:MAG: hypothetical protein ACMG6E_00915 [Candidatus Roizmanbacteria bacterium]
MDEVASGELKTKLNKRHPVRDRVVAGIAGVGLAFGLSGSRADSEVTKVVPKRIPVETIHPIEISDFNSGIPFPILPEIVTEVEGMDPDSPVPDDLLKSRYHTFIHNSPTTKLEIMPEALKNEPAFSRVRTRPNSELHIVLLNGPDVDSRFLPTDIHDQDLKSQMAKDVERRIEAARRVFPIEKEIAGEWLTHFESEVSSQGGYGDLSIEQIEEVRMLLRIYRASYEVAPTDEELRKRTNPLGEAKETLVTIRDKDNSDTVLRRTYVLIPALLESRERSPRDLALHKILRLMRASNKGVLPAGMDESIDTMQRIGLESFLDPLKLEVDVHRSIYPISSQNIATIARHEMKHAGGLNHPRTDFAVLDDLYDASRRYQAGEAWNPEAVDKRGYYYKFTTPEGEFFSQKREPSPATRAHKIGGHTVMDFKARADIKDRLRKLMG